MIVCAVPVKDLAAAKQRLVPALGPQARRALARAMLRDVLTALGAARLDRVWVVTRDAEVAAAAGALGAEPLAPPTPAENASHTAAIGVALAPPDAMPLRFGEPSFAGHLAAARARGLAPRVLVLHGLGLDVDTPDDLAALLAEGAATESARLVAGWRAVPVR